MVVVNVPGLFALSRVVDTLQPLASMPASPTEIALMQPLAQAAFAIGLNFALL
jgi:hypothetical protein